MERQESGSSSISFNSWGSDLAEETRDEYKGFKFNGLRQETAQQKQKQLQQKQQEYRQY